MDAVTAIKERVIDELTKYETSYLMYQLFGEDIPMSPHEMRDKIESLRNELATL